MPKLEKRACAIRKKGWAICGSDRQDGGEADASAVVDGDVPVFVACSSRFSCGDAVAGLNDPRQTLDVEVVRPPAYLRS